MTRMENYLIAVKRERRSELSFSAMLEGLRRIPGVRLVGGTEGKLARFTIAHEDVLKTVKRIFGQLCHIEVDVHHELQAKPRTVTRRFS